MTDTAVDVFRCSLPADPASQAVLDNLRVQGLLCADHTLRSGGREIAALLQSEINLLNDAGIAVEVLNRIEPPPSDDSVATDIATGFVSTYLDTAGIHAAYSALQASFPGLSTSPICRNRPPGTTAAHQVWLVLPQ